MPISSIRFVIEKETNQMLFVLHTNHPELLVKEEFQHLTDLPLDEISVKRYRMRQGTWFHIVCKSKVEPISDVKFEGSLLLGTLLTAKWQKLLRIDTQEKLEQFFARNLLPTYEEDEEKLDDESNVDEILLALYCRHSSETQNNLPSYDDSILFEEIAKITQENEDMEDDCLDEGLFHKQSKTPLTFELLRELQSKFSILRGSWMIYLDVLVVLRQFLNDSKMEELQRDHKLWRTIRDDWTQLPPTLKECREQCQKLMVEAKDLVVQSFFNGELHRVQFVDQIAVRKFEKGGLLVRVYNKVSKWLDIEPPKMMLDGNNELERTSLFLQEFDYEPLQVANILKNELCGGSQYLVIKYKPHIYTLLQIYDWDPKSPFLSTIYRILLSSW